MRKEKEKYEGPRLRGPFVFSTLGSGEKGIRPDMTKSELIETLALKQTHLMQKDVELAVRLILDHVSNALEREERVEIRGFGSFALHHRPARIGRNPKTGEAVEIPSKRVPHFKPGKEMRERVNAALQHAADTAGL